VCSRFHHAATLSHRVLTMRDVHSQTTPQRRGTPLLAASLLDWDLATTGTPTVEFAWYLCHDAWRIDASHDELEADYRPAEGGQLHPGEVELGMLTGLAQYGWIFGHSPQIHPDPDEQAWAKAELDWWVPRTRRALEHKGGMPRSSSEHGGDSNCSGLDKQPELNTEGTGP
jgi:hypothetical protein